MARYLKGLFLILFMGLTTGGACSDASIATWSGTTNPFLYPYYSIYDGTAWSTPRTIGNPGDYQTTATLYTALDTLNGQTMVVWADYPDNRPVYAIFSNGSWNTPAFISADLSITSADVYISFDPIRQIFLATWSNTATSPGIPHYSVYSNGTWSTPTAITGGTGTNNNVTSSFNPHRGEMVVTWQNVAGPDAYYAIYSGTMSAGSVLEIPISADSDLFSTFDSSTNTTIAMWAGNNASTGYYSAYSGSWTSPNIIPNTSGEMENAVTPSYNPVLQQVIATWVDGSHHHQVPLYSIYDGSGWTTDQEMSSTFVSSLNIYSSFNDQLQKTIAVMVDTALTTTQPVYSIYDGTGWSDLGYITTDPTYAAYRNVYIGPIRLINPPSALSGYRQKNDFGLMCEYYDTLTWSFNDSGSVAAYNIYANQAQIAQVGPAINQYQNHNRQKTASIVYGITTVDLSGNESLPITILIN